MPTRGRSGGGPDLEDGGEGLEDSVRETACGDGGGVGVCGGLWWYLQRSDTYFNYFFA